MATARTQTAAADKRRELTAVIQRKAETILRRPA